MDVPSGTSDKIGTIQGKSGKMDNNFSLKNQRLIDFIKRIKKSKEK
jgi:hypothetical protein